jgi:hypothetical protein
MSFSLPSIRSFATGLALSTISCDDSVKPFQPESAASPITVAYVCGNDFVLGSRSAAAVTVNYQVVGRPYLPLRAYGRDRGGRSAPQAFRPDRQQHAADHPF